MLYSLNFASVNNFVPDKAWNLEDSSKMHSGATDDLLVCCVWVNLLFTWLNKVSQRTCFQDNTRSPEFLVTHLLSIRKYFRKKRHICKRLNEIQLRNPYEVWSIYGCTNKMMILRPTTPYIFLDGHQSFGRTAPCSATQNEAAGSFENPVCTFQVNIALF